MPSPAKKLNELNPNLYPAKAVTSSVTRAQVQAELAEAKRTGDILVARRLGEEA